MKSKILISVTIFGSLLLMVAFNNCGGEVQFEEYMASEDEISQAFSGVPEDELEIKRPLTDLEDDDTLYEVYACDNSSGNVMICHFPNNVESSSTHCVGRKAVKSHYGHEVSYNIGDGDKVASDYLGPCRFPL